MELGPLALAAFVIWQLILQIVVSLVKTYLLLLYSSYESLRCIHLPFDFVVALLLSRTDQDLLHPYLNLPVIQMGFLLLTFLFLY